MLPIPSDEHTAIDYLRQTTTEQDAYTITCLYEIETDIVSVMDARYVWSNKKAKQMFGRALGEVGHEWQSYTLDSITRYQSALLGLKRAKTQNRDTYLAPIMLKNGDKRDVAKTVTALVRDHSIYYCTKIEPAERHMDAVHIRDIKLPDAEEFDYCHAFMSDLRELMTLGTFEMVKKRDYGKINAQAVKNNLTTRLKNHSIVNMINASPKLIFDTEFIIVPGLDGNDIMVYLGNGPGESFWLDDGTVTGSWIHRCKFCNYSWRSDFPRPDRCMRQTGSNKCRLKNWWRGAPPNRTHSERAKLAKNPGPKKRCLQ